MVQWSLDIRQGDRIRHFENKGLRGMFGHKRPDVMGGWRMLLGGKICNFSEIRKDTKF